MRDDAARALRVDDDMPRHRAELRSVDTIDDPYAELRARATERRFERTPRPPAMAPVALEEPVRETVSLPRPAPAPSYGSPRRADGFVPATRVAGAQPGRRTIEITGQV